MAINPNISADCHASGSVTYIATVVRGDHMLKMCGHCLVAPRLDTPTHLDVLIERGWDVHPVKRAGTFQWFGAGTEGTPDHFALGNF